MEDPARVTGALAIADKLVNVPTNPNFLRDLDDDSSQTKIKRQSTTDSLSKDVEPRTFPTFYAAFRVAPVVAIYAFAGGMFGPVWTETLKNRVCNQGLMISANICAHINSYDYKKEGDLVRSETVHYQLYDTLVGSGPAILFTIFVGAWSDKFGRKLPMIFPLLGSLMAAAYMSALANFPTVPAFILVSSLLGSITGGWTIFYMALFSFIGDHTTNTTRAMNIGVIDGLSSIFGNLASLLGGHIYQRVGNVIPFYIITGLYGLTIVYIILFIRDREDIRSREKPGIGSLFTVKNLEDNFQMLKKDRIGATRLHIWLTLLSVLVFSICIAADWSVMQIFTEFEPFQWDIEQYTVFTSSTGFITSCFVMIAMVVFRKVFHASDTIISFVASLSALMSYYVYGVATKGWMLYLAAGVGVMKLLVFVSIRAIMSHLVDANEIGKGLSLISSLQAIAPLIGTTIFTNIFAFTSSWWPGLSFVVAAFVMVPVVAMLGYVDVTRRSHIYREKA